VHRNNTVEERSPQPKTLLMTRYPAAASTS
jgi:hypothetical protein